jgi:hypothetical protein
LRLRGGLILLRDAINRDLGIIAAAATSQEWKKNAEKRKPNEPAKNKKGEIQADAKYPSPEKDVKRRDSGTLLGSDSARRDAQQVSASFQLADCQRPPG